MNGLEHLAALEADATRLVELVALADQSAPVPTCPAWTVADLVDHVGTLYRWSAAHVATAARARLSPRSLDLGLTEAGAYSRMAGRRASVRCWPRSPRPDPELICWGWGGDRRARFWPRRMLFETVVHRTDAAFALEVEPVVDADVAVEGIDELLSNLPHAAYFAPGLADLRGDDECIALRATDADAMWLIRLVPAGYAWDWSDGPADVTLHGRAADLLLGLYRRREVDEAARFDARATSRCSTASSTTSSSDPEGFQMAFDPIASPTVTIADHREPAFVHEDQEAQARRGWTITSRATADGRTCSSS